MIRKYSSNENPDQDIYINIRKSNWGVKNDQWGIQIDVKVTPIYCLICNKQLPEIYKIDGGRYGAVGSVICDNGHEIFCTDSDNLVDYLLLTSNINKIPTKYRIEFNYLYQLTNESFLQIKNKLNFDIFQMENEKWISLNKIIDEIISVNGINLNITSHSTSKFSTLPFLVNRWLSLLDEVKKMPIIIPPKKERTLDKLKSLLNIHHKKDAVYEFINFENLNDFLKDYSTKNECGHQLKDLQLKNLSNIYGIRKIGDLNDPKLGTLSYLSVKINNVYLLGSYPLHDCEIYMCDKCNQVFFSHINDGGIAPRTENFIANHHQHYLNEPAVKSIYINEKKINEFFDLFGLHETEKMNSDNYANLALNKIPQSAIIIDYNKNFINGENIVHFSLLSHRKFLYEVNVWLNNNKEI